MEYLSENIGVGTKIFMKKDKDESMKIKSLDSLPKELTITEDYSFNGFFDAVDNDGNKFSVTVYEVDNHYQI